MDNSLDMDLLEIYMTKLLPCPFCGGKVVVNEYKSLGYYRWIVSCNLRKSDHLAQVLSQPTKQDAIKIWNRRVS